ncbi:hypothetical protein StrepF001_10565 [Streptomyces sp. F001]|nr:hypothetical protein StrepF001_10565 [Streptomyces sp. F001]
MSRVRENRTHGSMRRGLETERTYSATAPAPDPTRGGLCDCDRSGSMTLTYGSASSKATSTGLGDGQAADVRPRILPTTPRPAALLPACRLSISPTTELDWVMSAPFA